MQELDEPLVYTELFSAKGCCIFQLEWIFGPQLGEGASDGEESVEHNRTY